MLFSVKRSKVRTCVFGTALVVSGGAFIPAADADVSFKDKQVEILIASGPGGGTDLTGRLFGRFFETYLPGKPTVVIRNFGTGGGKIRALNHLMNKAKPDGLSVMQSDATGSSPSTRQRRSARYNPLKFRVVGSINRGGSVLFVRKDARKRMEDKSQRPVIVAALGGMRPWQTMPLWGAEALGWNLRWIPGYGSKGAALKALRQGEVDMFATNDSLGINELLKDGVIELVAQAGTLGEDDGFAPRATYPDVPVFPDMLQKAKVSKLDWQAFIALMAPVQLDKWMALPPGTSEEHVQAYRSAYRDAFKDPEFIKMAKKQISTEIYFISGKNAEKMLHDIHSVPDEALQHGLDLQAKYGLAARLKK